MSFAGARTHRRRRASTRKDARKPSFLFENKDDRMAGISVPNILKQIGEPFLNVLETLVPSRIGTLLNCCANVHLRSITDPSLTKRIWSFVTHRSSRPERSSGTTKPSASASLSRTAAAETLAAMLTKASSSLSM